MIVHEHTSRFDVLARTRTLPAADARRYVAKQLRELRSHSHKPRSHRNHGVRYWHVPYNVFDEYVIWLTEV